MELQPFAADYFALQFVFARRYAQAAGVSLHEAVDRVTNMRRRLRLEKAEGKGEWLAFLGRLDASLGDDALLALARQCHGAVGGEAMRGRFGCFNFDPPDARGMVRVHFLPPFTNGPGALAKENAGACKAELQAMFGHVRQQHADARLVRGTSWLYNLDAYKRLFPPAYVRSIAMPTTPLQLTGTSTWGQVLDHHGRVKPAMREQLLARLGALDVEAPWRVFPLHALAAEAGIEHFTQW